MEVLDASPWPPAFACESPERTAKFEHTSGATVGIDRRTRQQAGHDSGFTLQSVQSDNALIPWSRRPVTTLCTPMGVVLRGDAPPILRDAVNRAAPGVAASLRSSLADRATAAATNTLRDATDTVQGLISRLRPN